MNRNLVFLCLFIPLLTGCSTVRTISVPVTSARVARDRLPKPLVKSGITVTIKTNVAIRPRYKLEESIHDALIKALNHANIFGRDASNPYEVVIEVLGWHQPAGNWGKFTSTMNTHCILKDSQGKIVLDQKVATKASSDKWVLAAHKRALGGAKATVAENVIETVEILKAALIDPPDSKRSVSKEGSQNIAEPSGNLSQELQKLSELHDAGVLSDEEFKKAKAKLLSN